MKIYTKTGDKGSTSLVGGKRVSKADSRLQAYGTVDELNAVLGLARAHLNTLELKAETTAYCQQMHDWLSKIQHRLFNLGSHLACPDEKSRASLPAMDPAWTQQMESWMDLCETQLPALTNFILPGGSITAAQLHLARTVCRRAERHAVLLLEDADTTHSEADLASVIFLNRLSDLLFVLARYANFNENFSDTNWDKNCE